MVYTLHSVAYLPTHYTTLAPPPPADPHIANIYLHQCEQNYFIKLYEINDTNNLA